MLKSPSRSKTILQRRTAGRNNALCLVQKFFWQPFPLSDKRSQLLVSLLVLRFSLQRAKMSVTRPFLSKGCGVRSGTGTALPAGILELTSVSITGRNSRSCALLYGRNMPSGKQRPKNFLVWKALECGEPAKGRLLFV